jgi:O-acetyl-ADP-ribose deacetylase
MNNNSRIELLKADITKLDVDAIVNAANNSLLGGGGVDGAIHKAAGTDLLTECIKLNGCETGHAKITGGYNLKAKYIIHTVGPVWKGGQCDELILLSSCYQSSLRLAKEKKIKSLAFPNISTGAFGFPKELAAIIAIKETIRFIEKNNYPEKVIFVAFSDDNYETYCRILEQCQKS